MNSTNPIRNFVFSAPASLKRLGRFCVDPSLHLRAQPDSDLQHVLMDYLASLSIVVGVMAAIGALIPWYMETNPISMLRIPLFMLLMTVNAVTFALSLWLVSVVVLVFSGVRLHGVMFYQGIKSYAILNIPVAVIFVIAINRLILVNDFNVAPGSGDVVFATIVALLGFALGIWLVAVPAGRYLRRRYRPAVAYPLGLAIYVFASLANPVVASQYFSNALDEHAFCEKYISARVSSELRGTYDKDCLVGKCVAALKNNRSNKGMEPTR